MDDELTPDSIGDSDVMESAGTSRPQKRSVSKKAKIGGKKRAESSDDAVAEESLRQQAQAIVPGRASLGKMAQPSFNCRHSETSQEISKNVAVSNSLDASSGESDHDESGVSYITIRIPVLGKKAAEADSLVRSYCSTQLAARLSLSEARTLRRMFKAVDEQGLRFGEGRRVTSPGQTIRWLLQQIEKECETAWK